MGISRCHNKQYSVKIAERIPPKMKYFNHIKSITKESISKYGILLDHINQEDGYEPLIKVTSRGWIWAILTFKNKTTDYIECHPTSKESFEPVFGTSLIILSIPEDPTQTEVFLLDKPIMLNEGVWHNVITISDVSRVKITENNDVTSEYYRYPKPIGTALFFEE